MKTYKKFLSSIISVLFLLSAASPFGTFPVQAADSAAREMAVHFIDVGQGLAVLVQSAGENLLYDGGSQSHAETLTAYLQKQNVETIDYMISSHYDEDHVGGLVDCLNTFSVETVIGPDYTADTQVYSSFMESISLEGLTVEHPAVGDSHSFGSGSFTVLAPDGIHPDDGNNNSVVIKLENGENSFLFTGDAAESSEQDLISSGQNLDCDVLCVGHHGSQYSTTYDLLESTTPEGAVISCGTGNRYGHPSAETMERLFSMDIPVYRTDLQGTVIALSDGSNIAWNVQPTTDYSSGDLSDGTEESASQQQEQQAAPQQEEQQPAASQTEVSSMVWLSATGEKYHSIPDCGRMNPAKARQIEESVAISQGYGKCQNCF